MKYTREAVEKAVTISRSYLETLRNLGVQGVTGVSYTHLRRKIKEFGLDTSHFSGCSWAKRLSGISYNQLSPEKILVVVAGHSRIQAKFLRRALVESGVPYICNKCGLEPCWNGEPMNFEVDHIDGNWRDCRKDNLQFLCPNCHSQKGITRVKVCRTCGVIIHGKSGYCQSCCVKEGWKSGTFTHLVKGDWPDDRELFRLVWVYPVTEVASRIGVSSSMVKKRCKRLGINTPPRGYWAKRKVMAPSSTG